METLVQLGATKISLKQGKSRPVRKISELHGRIIDLRQGRVFTTGEVSALLGTQRHVIQRWIASGYLKADRTSKYKKSWWLIVHDALLDALRNPSTWPDWQVEDITDADWHWAAEQIRSGVW
jgi:alkylated DNA nucleotide flippase Atl1